jgi:hypothetical protein
MQFLALLDWDLPIPFTPGPAAEEAGALCYLLRVDTGTTLICYFLRPGLLEKPSRLLEEKRDHSLLTHALAAESRSPNIQYLFISDLGRHYLYHMPEGELLTLADTPEIFNSELQQIFRRSSVQDGSLDDLPRPSRCGRARRLDQWREYWKETLQREVPVSEEALHLLLDRLVLLRYLFPKDLLRRTLARLEERFLQLCEFCPDSTDMPSRGWGDKLRRLFHDMWLDWRIALFAPHLELDAFLTRAPSLPHLLQSSLLLSETLFTFDIILESFNNGDAREKLRVRMVPDHNEEREMLLRRQTPDTIDTLQMEVDLRDEGYRAIIHWLDKILDCYEQMDAHFDTPAAALSDDEEEPDLFSWSERNHGRPEACIDPISHLCAQGLRIRCNTPAQRRLATLLLTLRLIDLCHEKHQARDRLPRTDPVFTESRAQIRSDGPRIVLPPISDLD